MKLKTITFQATIQIDWDDESTPAAKWVDQSVDLINSELEASHLDDNPQIMNFDAATIKIGEIEAAE